MPYYMPPSKVDLFFNFQGKEYKAFYTIYVFAEAKVFVAQVDDEQTRSEFGDFLLYRHIHHTKDFSFPVESDPGELNGIKGVVASAIAKQEELWD